MTRHDVDSLLRDWDEVSRTARTPAPAPRAGRMGGAGPAALPLLLAVVLAVAGIALFGRLPGRGPTDSADTNPGPPAAGAGPVIDAVDDGTLRLTLTADRGTYADGDAIVAAAALDYIGPDAEIVLFTALDQVVFNVAEVGGDRQAGGGSRQSCNRHTLARGEPVSFPWAKFAAYVPGDPAQAFAEWYAKSGPTLRLPAGMWRLSATFEASEGDCGPSTHTLTAEVVVTVEPATAASGGPSPEAVTPLPSATFTPDPTAPYAGPSNVVTCGRLSSLACGRLLGMLAADHATELAAATRIVVDDSCPPSAQCDRQYAFDAFVLVVPPAGIDEAVAYLATGNEGPDEVRAYTDAIPAHLLARAAGPGTAPEAIPIPTGDPPQPAATPAACPAALIEGRLVADERWGVGLRASDPPDASVIRIVWPYGTTARVDSLGIVVVGPEGAPIAHVGQELQIGGGEGPNGGWRACGEIMGVSTSLGGP